MIPFPGESLALFRASADGDRSIETAIIKRGSYFAGSGATEATITSGDVWRAWVAPGSATYLESAGEDVAVSWVVEVLSGTVAVAAGESLDPDYGNDTLDAATSLGAHTVTGPATLVIPSGFTAADVVDGADALMLHLAATSGSAVVQQVKLRVWPTTGAVGGWSDLKPSWQTTPVNPGWWEVGAVIEGTATAATAEAAWDAAVAAFHDDADAKTPTQPRAFGTKPAPGAEIGNSASQILTHNGLEASYDSTTSVNARLVMLLGDDWSTRDPIQAGLVEGVDFIRPPTEVQGDTLYFAQQVGSGSTGWQDATLTMHTTGDDVPGTVVLYMDSGYWPNLTPGAGTTYDVPIGTSGIYTDGAHSLPTDGLMIYLSVSHTIVTGASDTWPGWDPGPTFGAGWTETLNAALDAVKTYAVLPPYRVWSPTVAHRRPLRQWPLEQGDGGSPRRYGRDALSSYGSGAPRRYGAGYQ